MLRSFIPWFKRVILRQKPIDHQQEVIDHLVTTYGNKPSGTYGALSMRSSLLRIAAAVEASGAKGKRRVFERSLDKSRDDIPF